MVARQIGNLAIIRIAIEHRTVYRYDRPVRLGPHVIRLRPAPHSRTPILAYSLTVKPERHFINWQQDPSGNHLARCVFPEPTAALEITVDLVADMTVVNPFDFFIDESARTWPFDYDAGLAQDLAPYLAPADNAAHTAHAAHAAHAANGSNGRPAARTPLLDEWVAGIPRTPTPLIEFLVGLNRRVRDDIDYSVRMEHGVQTPEETLDLGVGSCRDSSWLLVAILRRLGIAARFASGYLVQLAADRPAVHSATNGRLSAAGDPTPASGPTADSTDLHAWAEAYVPGAGWIGLDPTSGLLAGEGHIPLACTSTPAAAAPIEGRRAPAEATFEFSNSVTRFADEPRVSLPYTPDQWDRIDSVGLAVDDALERGDARLTMGGEPTFVAIGAGRAGEWNTAADGPTKRRLATAFGISLAHELAPGALIQHSQGKWYPGEPRPRWQVAVNWRTDGHALWNDPDLLADPTTTGGATAAETRGLAETIAAGLGLPPEICIPAYEDPVGRLWTEARLPDGPPPGALAGDPPDAALSDAAGRAAIIAVLDAERGEPKGFAIPLHRAPGDDCWSTGRWTIRRRTLFLIAGDSPVGLRLPLRSIAWAAPPPESDLSLFAPAGDLPPIPVQKMVEQADPPPITALCVELRRGHPHVFLPPLKDFGHFAELVAVVEAAAAARATPVVIEGYSPPPDTRLQHFSVTPDPGVIEVNIHPSETWPDLVANTTTIYARAGDVGLCAEKFTLDGLHTATGGGSHLTLGGPRPADSPILRRPDLLRSLVTFWQHHPSLSYLFSGRFVGPTSQAPRVDEGRHESLYELEIAFAELDRLAAGGRPASPWQIDRLLRNLLVDLSGNTHRAEFCIDKLFDPDSEHGRLGVVELRGFEMAPHPQMALVQGLLVRCLVARFWAEPYAGRLVRWGTDLHDRFLLPWWIAADIRAVTEDLAAHGFPFEAAWVDPFLEFRFPRLGVTNLNGVSLELRAAIEPWNVLGEDAAAGSSRFVDSSLERIQVRVDGLTPSREALTCNGCVVPLAPTGTPGSFVAGVRFRARQLTRALHPTIAVHTPLRFDLVDRQTKRSLGGASYHVDHPGGRSYDRVPANAKEAEARRASRFQPFGGADGPIDLDGVAAVGQDGFCGDGEYPRTLDLRRARRR